MKIIRIEVWQGNNFGEIVGRISLVNTEVKIKTIGKRLVINDRNVDYYQNVVIGDHVEVPVYDDCVICDEQEPEEVAVLPAREYDFELSNRMMREWGLLS